MHNVKIQNDTGIWVMKFSQFIGPRNILEPTVYFKLICEIRGWLTAFQCGSGSALATNLWNSWEAIQPEKNEIFVMENFKYKYEIGPLFKKGIEISAERFDQKRDQTLAYTSNHALWSQEERSDSCLHLETRAQSQEGTSDTCLYLKPTALVVTGRHIRHLSHAL